MSAAAVIIIRIKRVFSYMRSHQALSPESAIPESEIPYSQKWYFQRLIKYGVIKRTGNKFYLDETLAESYLRERRKRGYVFCAVVILAFCLYLFVRWFLS